MKSERDSDEIFGVPPQMKLNPSYSPREAGFHREAISSTEGGFIPSARTDLVEKSQVEIGLGFFLGRGRRIQNPCVRLVKLFMIMPFLIFYG